MFRHPATRSRPQPMPTGEVQELLDFGQRSRWPFKYWGQAPIPECPVRIRGGWLVPIEQDGSQVPDRARKRVEAIYGAGFRPKGFVIAHEAPLLLEAPPKVEEEVARKKIELPQIDLGQLIANPWVRALALAPLIVLCAPALAFVGLIGAAILVDPVLLAVTEDDCWVEVDRWDA